MKTRYMIILVIYAMFGNSNTCVVIRLFCLSMNGTTPIALVGEFRTDSHCTSIDVTSRWYKNDHFILPSQAKQVFYLDDTKFGETWKVVQWVKHREMYDVAEVIED